MSPYNSEAPVLDTYQAVVSAYSDFLTVAIHTILYERNIYPQTSFLKARKYNYPVRQSRHPRVCKWIQDAVAAVEAEMLKCTVATTSLIIHAPPPTSTPLERYVFSTAAFPRIPPTETLTPFQPTLSTTTSPPQNPSTDANDPHPSPTALNDATLKRFHPPPISNLPEQFRATLSRLTNSLTRLGDLPENCSFTVAIELRDEEGVQTEPPIGREEDRRWVVAEPGWQRASGDGGRREEDGKSEEDGKIGQDGVGKQGRYLGGVRTTPVRSVEAGAFAMEVWVEEGKGKFQAGVEDGDGDEDEQR